MTPDDAFADALVAAPVGAVLLAVLEAGGPGEGRGHLLPAVADEAAVQRAVEAVREMSLGALLSTAVNASAWPAGAWMPAAAGFVAAARQGVEPRRPIAVAIAERFGTALHAPLDRAGQEWWWSARPGPEAFARGLSGFAPVYGGGQFTWGGLWTTTAPPPEVHPELVDAWEMDPDPVTRWALPVRPPARVWEVHRPADWARLVAAHPTPGPVEDVRWELAGRGRLLAPDWAAVAAEHDGVHLSWAGFLTCEGTVIDLGGGDVALLRYWFSERTHWLADVFGEPVPLPAPVLTPPFAPGTGIDVRHDAVRRGGDAALLRHRLGR